MTTASNQKTDRRRQIRERMRTEADALVAAGDLVDRAALAVNAAVVTAGLERVASVLDIDAKTVKLVADLVSCQVDPPRNM